ncbi:unnamed protein product [Camellia sinensis]
MIFAVNNGSFTGSSTAVGFGPADADISDGNYLAGTWMKDGMRSMSKRRVEGKHWCNRTRSHITLDVAPSEPVEQGKWANLPPELLLDIIWRVEESETTWPARTDVVFCASVCKSWRDITKEIVKTPEECGRLTFPISLKQVTPRLGELQMFRLQQESKSIGTMANQRETSSNKIAREKGKQGPDIADEQRTTKRKKDTDPNITKARGVDKAEEKNSLQKNKDENVQVHEGKTSNAHGKGKKDFIPEKPKYNDQCTTFVSNLSLQFTRIYELFSVMWVEQLLFAFKGKTSTLENQGGHGFSKSVFGPQTGILCDQVGCTKSDDASLSNAHMIMAEIPNASEAMVYVPDLG